MSEVSIQAICGTVPSFSEREYDGDTGYLKSFSLMEEAFDDCEEMISTSHAAEAAAEAKSVAAEEEDELVEMEVSTATRLDASE